MYTVEIDELVFSEDFRRIDKTGQRQIIKAVRKKLAEQPSAYGKRLADPFKGFWKLRVGRYRVIYQIIESRVAVYVVKAGYRRDREVYEELARRLKL